MLRLGADAMRQTECARLLFKLVARELWLLKDTLHTQTHTHTHVQIHMFSSQNVQKCQGNHPLKCNLQRRESYWGKFWLDIQKGNTASISPDRDETELARAGNHNQRSASQGGNANKTCSMMPQVRCIPAVQPLPNSYKQWINAKLITSFNLP